MIGRIALLLAAMLTAILSLGMTFFAAETTAAAVTTNVTSIADSSILENAPTTNYGGATTLGADGDEPSGSGMDMYGLLRWDLSSMAPGTKISSASVTLTVTNSSTQTYQAYALKRAWAESEVTWNSYAAGRPWEVAGAKGSLDREATVAGTVTPSATGERTFALSAAVVQRWVDNPTTNQGIIIANATNSNGFDFYSRESSTSSQRPRLTLNVEGVVTQNDPVFVGAGDIASCASSGDEATANLLDSIPGTVYTLGDSVYDSGTDAEFANCYNSSWGRHKARTKPSVGNHEYHTAGASGYYKYFGAAAGESSKGYYSYDLGAWHIVALNSMCENVGGCGATSPMVTWLMLDLATNPSFCTLAYWHHPVFSSGSEHGSNPKMIPSWDALYAAGADVVLSGHDHDYERFAPQTSSGVGDPAQGIREFVVGTGGKSHYAFGTIRANSEVRNSDTNGVLKLTLHASSYEWQFVPEAGKTFSDSGSASCHSAPLSTTDRPGPPSLTSADPGANATGVSTTTNVTAFFSEEMDSNTINTKTFNLFKKGSSTKIPAVVTYSPDERVTTDTVEARATLDPNNSLQSGVTYKAVVTTGAKDSVGNPLPQQYKWFFTTVR